jgi:hypothetical protein
MVEESYEIYNSVTDLTQRNRNGEKSTKYYSESRLSIHREWIKKVESTTFP